MAIYLRGVNFGTLCTSAEFNVSEKLLCGLFISGNTACIVPCTTVIILPLSLCVYTFICELRVGVKIISCVSSQDVAVPGIFKLSRAVF